MRARGRGSRGVKSRGNDGLCVCKRSRAPFKPQFGGVTRQLDHILLFGGGRTTNPPNCLATKLGTLHRSSGACHRSGCISDTPALVFATAPNRFRGLSPPPPLPGFALDPSSLVAIPPPHNGRSETRRPRPCPHKPPLFHWRALKTQGVAVCFGSVAGSEREKWESQQTQIGYEQVTPLA